MAESNAVSERTQRSSADLRDAITANTPLVGEMIGAQGDHASHPPSSRIQNGRGPDSKRSQTPMATASCAFRDDVVRIVPHYAEDIQEPGWWAPLSRESLAVEASDPYRAQIEHFARVVRGEGVPLVSGEEALASLAVVEAIGEATRTGRVVRIRDVLGGEPPSLG